MIFSSIIFLCYFLPLFLVLYHISGKSIRNNIILIGSIFFYAWGAPKFLFVILASTILDFYIVKNLYLSQSISRKRLFLSLSLTMNLGLLAYFKYANFFVGNINQLLSFFGVEQIAWVSVALPIGISFYTFQTLTYSIDVYRGIQRPLDKLSDYLLYIMSFPQMIAGPIVRFNLIADQIVDRKESIDDKLSGFNRLSIGLAKKVLIANVMAEQADLILNGDLINLSSSSAWIGIIAYTFQIYFDFSGYSDMAIGLGKLMGFRFPENFDSPYIAKSISEFWRRWHMTLGGFMRDYLYIPLVGNRVKSNMRLYFNLWLVFLLSGFWHGASWNFVIWGAYHGFFLILDRFFFAQFLKRIGKIPSMLITFFLVMMGWVIFRLESISDIVTFFHRLFSFRGCSSFHTVPSFNTILLLAIFFSFFKATNIGDKIVHYFFHQDRYGIMEHIGLFLMSICLFVLSMSSLVASDFNPFIYFRF